MERDSQALIDEGNFEDFNSHAHVERDIFVMPPTKGEIDFNSHAHVERDQSGIELAFTQDISTHTLTWSVTSVEFGALLKMLDFNSHAHVERDRSFRQFHG